MRIRWTREGALRATALSAVVVSFALNVTALFVPFLGVSVIFEGRSLYSLPRSVVLLWDAGLYVLALLVALFSIVFPFAKLVVLVQAGLGRGPEELRRRRLERVGRLGRWSMLDVFLAALLLGLTNDRFFVDTQARIGLPLFALAIALSLIAGEILERAHGAAPLRPPRRASGRDRLLLALAWLILSAALLFPFLQIEDWRLRDDSFSLLGLTEVLWGASASVGFVMVAFVVVVPLLELVALSACAVATPRTAAYAAAWRRQLGRWSMLEVFVLALAIFMVEGHAFVRTELRWGTLLLVGALFLHLLARNALETRLRRRTQVRRPDERSGDLAF